MWYMTSSWSTISETGSIFVLQILLFTECPNSVFGRLYRRLLACVEYTLVARRPVFVHDVQVVAYCTTSTTIGFIRRMDRGLRGFTLSIRACSMENWLGKAILLITSWSSKPGFAGLRIRYKAAHVSEQVWISFEVWSPRSLMQHIANLKHILGKVGSFNLSQLKLEAAQCQSKGWISTFLGKVK